MVVHVHFLLSLSHTQYGYRVAFYFTSILSFVLRLCFVPSMTDSDVSLSRTQHDMYQTRPLASTIDDAATKSSEPMILHDSSIVSST